MESLIYIGAKVDKETAKNLGGFVASVFKSGKDNGMDQSTIVVALGLASKIVTPSGVNMSDCNFTNHEKSQEA